MQSVFHMELRFSQKHNTALAGIAFGFHSSLVVVKYRSPLQPVLGINFVDVVQI